MKKLIILLLILIIFIAGCTQQPTGRALEVNTQQNASSTENQQSSQVSVDPCANMVCNDYCSGNTRYTNGYCVGGQCKYSSDYCQNGCSNGRCNPLPKSYRVGDTIQMSGLKITLNSIRTDYHIGTYYTYINQYQNEAKSGYKYYIVLITVENTGSESKYVSAGYLTILDSNKNQYDYSSSTYSLTKSFEGKDLLSGAKNSGEVAFEVPESASALKLYYEIDSYNDIYAIWDLSNVNVSTQSSKDCGNAGQSCCDNQCSRENICSGGICVACSKDNQPPCSDGCYYGYELIGGTCKKECSYGQMRVGGICQDCGGLNEPCCSDSKCDYSKVCKNNVCVNCGSEAGQPCCLGETKCLSFPTTTCINDVCQYCGRTGEICCEGNKCNAGQICKNGVCEECGSTGQQCCGPENYYTCFIGSCQSGICVYP